jgi:insulysin
MGISIGLTEKGVANYDEILRIFFAYLNEIRREGPKSYVFEENKITHEINFQNQTKPGALQSAKYGAQSMAQLSPNEAIEDLYFRPYAYEEWNPNEIKAYLDLLQPDNCYYILQAKENAKRPDQRKEFYYGTSYTSQKFDKDFCSALAHAQIKQTEKLGNCPPNIFIPKQHPSSLLKEKVAVPALPSRLESKNGSTVWFKQDDTFEQPFLWSRVTIFTNDIGFPMNYQGIAFFNFWYSLLSENLRELEYLAQLGGL